MAVRTRVDSIAADINLFVSELLSPEAQSQAIANFARGAIAEADETNRRVLGRIPPRTVTVDGAVNGALESVKPSGGSIVAEWELIGDVLIWIGQTLRDRSPVVSGKYRDSHTLFADGVEVPIGQQVPQAEEYVFLNLQPYARKIEIGKTKAGRAFVIQVDPLIYDRTAKDAKARFGNMANIKSTFRAPFDGRIVGYVALGRSRLKDWGDLSKRRGRFAASRVDADLRRKAQIERNLRVPAIVVTMRAR